MKRFLLTLLLVAIPAYADEPQLDHAFGPTESWQSLAFSPDSKKLAIAGSEGVKIYETATGRVLETRPACGWKTISVAWSPNGKDLVAGGIMLADKQRGEIVLWREGHKPLHWTTGNSFVEALAFSPDSRTLATGAAGNLSENASIGSVRTWSVATGKLQHTFLNHSRHSVSVAFSNDGKKLGYSINSGYNRTGQTFLADAATGRVLKRWRRVAQPLLMNGSGPVFQPDLLARRLKNNVEVRVEAIEDEDHMRYRYTARRMGQKKMLVDTELGVGASGAVFSGDYLATTMKENAWPGYESYATLWKISGNPPRAKAFKTFNRTLAPVFLSASNDRSTLTFTTNRGTAVVGSKFSQPRLVPPYTGLTPLPFAPTLSHDGQTLYNGKWLNIGPLKPVELVQEERVNKLGGSDNVLSPDGKALATLVGIVELASVPSRNLSLKRLNIPLPDKPGASEPEMLDSVWSPDSARIARLVSVPDERNRLFLYSRAGQLEREMGLPKQDRDFLTATFSPDGIRLATISASTSDYSLWHLDLWDATTGKHEDEIRISPLQTQLKIETPTPTLSFSPSGKRLGMSGIFFQNGKWSPRLLVVDVATKARGGSLPMPYTSFEFRHTAVGMWTFLDEKRVALLNGNALEVWDDRAHRRQKSLFLVPRPGGFQIVSRP
jgi:WD40 repeat protein